MPNPPRANRRLRPRPKANRQKPKPSPRNRRPKLYDYETPPGTAAPVEPRPGAGGADGTNHGARPFRTVHRSWAAFHTLLCESDADLLRYLRAPRPGHACP